MSKHIFLITSSFPYGDGEQFLETEIKYYDNVKLTILPQFVSDNKRETSDSINIDTFFADEFSKKNKYICLLKSLKHSFVFKELKDEKFWNISKLKIFFSSLYLYQASLEIFDKYFSNIKGMEDTVVYTYWNNETTYALQTLKKKYNYKIVSRIHGGDLYEERKAFLYMPLKNQFTDNMDKLYTITQSANSYLVKTYGFKNDTLELVRLGVEDKGIISLFNDRGTLHIVSCSFVSQVKRVDKIINTLEKLSNELENINIKWTHIGNGTLFEKMQKLAKDKLDRLTNIKYNFVGYLNNEEVYAFYKNNKVDVFLNVSESEGVPVSIMEAMSCYIPVVAPDVGGISDMVIDEYNGYLLSGECLVDEIVEKLKNVDFFKNEEVRDGAYKIFLEKYNAEVNYYEFIKKLEEL